MNSAIGISVLLSVYHKNTSIEFNRCLTSVANQTLQPNEVVVVFDGPVAEDLYGVIDNFKAVLNIQVVALTHNMGLGYALNAGLAKCACNYIARIDVDDICKENRLYLQYNFFKINSDVDILGGQIELFDDGGVYGVRHVPIEVQKIIRYSLIRNPINHSTVMFKKDSVLNVGGYPNVRFTQDYLLWIDCISKGIVICNLPDILVEMYADKDMFHRRGLRYFKYDVKPYIKNFQLKNNGIVFLCFVVFLRLLFNMFNSLKSTVLNIYKR